MLVLGKRLHQMPPPTFLKVKYYMQTYAFRRIFQKIFLQHHSFGSTTYQLAKTLDSKNTEDNPFQSKGLLIEDKTLEKVRHMLELTLN